MCVTESVAQVATAVTKVKRALDEQGIKVSADELQHFAGTETNSDKYQRMADPEFYANFRNYRGALDLALQGVEHLHSADQKGAWMGNRYSHPDDIRAGLNGADKLSPAQREGLIRQNAALDDMADMFEQYAEHLKQQGYVSDGPKSFVGKNDLLRAIEADLAQVDPAKYEGKSWLEKAMSKTTRGLYDMYVTGNWHIHGLHAVEAVTVGSSYDPAAFAKGVTSLLSKDSTARDFCNSFEASSGNMKRIKEDEHETWKLTQAWQKLQRNTVNAVGKAFGQADLAGKIENSKVADVIGETVEGSIMEKAKLYQLRAMSAHIAAAEMKYEGGGNKLMADMVKAMHDPTAMDPEARLEAAATIAHHMNQMVGYSPGGYTDLNIFGRLGKTKMGSFAKLFTPFTTTAIQQSRVLTKFFTGAANKIAAGDYVGAAASAGKGMMMLGIIASIGGRAAVPKEFQVLLHKHDPKLAKEFLQTMDKFNLIGKAFGGEVEHVTPRMLAYSFLGDGFQDQLLHAWNTAWDGDKDAMQRLRGAATIAAGLGVSSIGNRMGTGTIIKIAKGLAEGVQGSRVAWAFREQNTLDTLLHKEKPGTPSNYLGKFNLKTDPVQRLAQTYSPAIPFDEAELVNMARDDAAFRDKLNEVDPKFFARKNSERGRLNKAQEKAALPEARESASKKLEGFWERAYTQYMETHGKTAANNLSEGAK